MPLRAQAAPREPKAANLEVYRNPEVLVGDDHPGDSHELVTDWYYYAFIKESSTGESCA
jgi:hypothetical protein